MYETTLNPLILDELTTKICWLLLMVHGVVGHNACDIDRDQMRNSVVIYYVFYMSHHQ